MIHNHYFSNKRTAVLGPFKNHTQEQIESIVKFMYGIVTKHDDPEVSQIIIGACSPWNKRKLANDGVDAYMINEADLPAELIFALPRHTTIAKENAIDYLLEQVDKFEAAKTGLTPNCVSYKGKLFGRYPGLSNPDLPFIHVYMNAGSGDIVCYVDGIGYRSTHWYDTVPLIDATEISVVA